MKIDIEITDENFLDILLVEYSKVEEYLNEGFTSEEDEDYFTKLRDAFRVVVNYYSTTPL